MIIVGISNSIKLAKKIAKQKKAKYTELKVTEFPDGEINVQYQVPIKNKKIVIVQTMYPNPQRAMTEVIWAIHTAKQLKAKEIILVAPYLCYMRSDKRFKKGQSVSNTIMSSLLSKTNKIITVDPHLHRIRSLKEIFKIKTKRLSANLTIAEYIKKHFKNEVIVGPDWESFQWAEYIAKKINADATILKKTRYSSRHVDVKFTEKIELKNKNIILIDDIISTGHTIMEAIKKIKKSKPKSITCICVHGLFVENALKKINKLGAKVLCTNTIETKDSKIDLSQLISKNL